jgi:hypothetical protein
MALDQLRTHQYGEAYRWPRSVANSELSVPEPVVREVAQALAPYGDDRVLSFPIENHLAQAARPPPTADD